MQGILNAIGTFLILIASEFISPANASPLEEFDREGPKRESCEYALRKMSNLAWNNFCLPEESMKEYFQSPDYERFENGLYFLLSVNWNSTLTPQQKVLGNKIMERMWGPNDYDNRKKREALTEELETALGCTPSFSDMSIDFSIMAKGVDSSTTGNGNILLTLEEVDDLFQNTQFFLKVHGVNIICNETHNQRHSRYFYKGF